MAGSGAFPYETSSVSKVATPPRRINSFSVVTPRSEVVTESSLCKEICRLQNEQTPSPRPETRDTGTPDSVKAQQGRMLLTMSLEQPPTVDKEAEDDPQRQKDDPQDQNGVVWPASIGGILLMLSPLLIL